MRLQHQDAAVGLRDRLQNLEGCSKHTWEARYDGLLKLWPEHKQLIEAHRAKHIKLVVYTKLPGFLKQSALEKAAKIGYSREETYKLFFKVLGNTHLGPGVVDKHFKF